MPPERLHALAGGSIPELACAVGVCGKRKEKYKEKKT